MTFSIIISSRLSSYKFRWLNGCILSVAFAFIGYYLTINNYDNHKPKYFSNYISPAQTSVIADIYEPIKIKDRSVKAIVKILKVYYNGNAVKTSGKALIYFEKDSLTNKLKYGDRILINAQFHEISPPQNPNEINYKKYFAFKNLYHEAYVRSGSINIISRDNGNVIYKYAYLIRDKFLFIFKQNSITGKELAVGSAIIFGYRDLLDSDTIMEYSQAGVIHILCVAGLNVGIIYLIFFNLLFFLDRFKHGKLIKSLLLLLIIWSYTFICGLTPCILRASVMFTFILFGKIIGRQVNTLNAVITSAFILLLFNPFLITNLGFQHSYIAVIGIVILYPIINNLLTPTNIVFNKTWELISVSLAAQIFIFPIVISYYHYFPDYFVFTNLIVIPLVFLITYAGIIILAIYPIAGVVKLFPICFTYLIKILNYIIKTIEHAPFSVIKTITINSYELLLIYIIMLFILIAYINRNKTYLILSILTTLILVSLISFRVYSNMNKKQIIVYSVRKASAYDFINGNHHLLISNADSAHIHYLLSQQNIEGYEHLSGLSFKTNNLFINNNFIQFYNKKIVVINKYNYNLNPKIYVDYLIISDDIKISMINLLSGIKANEIIFDSSNSIWRINKWIDECSKLNTKYYSVPHSGAFILEL